MNLLAYSVLLILWGCCTAQAPCRKPEGFDKEEPAPGLAEEYKNGDIVPYSCRPGYIKLGRLQYQCNNGQWVKFGSARCKEKPCGHPGDIGFGTFEITKGDEFVFGARVEYSCDAGYQMISRITYRDCTATGWSNSLPYCEQRKCLGIQAPKGGRIVITGTQDIDGEIAVGHVLRFECDNPLARPVPREIYCKVTGEWSSDVVECKEIACEEPHISHGTIKNRKDFKKGNTLDYECDAGYKSEGRAPECTEQGWNPEPACTEIVCYYENVENGEVLPKRDIFKEGETVNLHCNFGFQAAYDQGPPPTCTKNGWVPPPRCKSKACDYPKIEGGKLHSWYYNTHTSRYFPMEKGRRIDFSCNDGFLTASGQQWGSITCTPDGWDPTPKCFRTCTLTPTNMETYKPKRTLFKDQERLQYECGDGYKTPRNNIVEKVQCTQGRWKNTPRCEEITCSLPSARGYLRSRTSGTFKNGDVENVRCEKGYTLRGDEQIQCYYFGWYPQPPSCEAIRGQCPRPPKLDNTIEFDPEPAYNHGDTITYECKANYKLYGSQTITCEQGRWTSPPQCFEIETCDWPPNIRNGAFNVARDKRIFYNEDTVTYSCAKGYHITGSSEITCIGGEWPSAPTCAEDTCNAPVIDHGSIVDLKPPYVSAATVQIKCDAGYRLSDQRKATCSKGEWLDLPSCLSTACSSAPEVLNAVVSGQEKKSYASGEKVVYKCKEGFALQGLGYTTCEEGQWVELPVCKKEGQSCDTAPFVANGDVDGASKTTYESGTYVDYKCQSYYTLEGPKRVHCRNGGWSSVPECLEPCTASPQEMATNNIQLKWISQDKLYIKHNEFVEFECKRGNYIKDQSASASPFRPQCNRGKLKYPKCIKQGSCVTSLTEMEENNIILERENTEVSNGETIEFTCKPGFYSMSVRAMKVTCNNGKLNYPQCGSTPCYLSQEIIKQNNLELFQPDLISDPVKHKTAVDFKCKEGYVEETSSEPSGQCNAGTIIYPLCVEYNPCKVTREKLDENNLQLHEKHGKELTFRYGAIINFKCQSGYIKPDSLYVKCDEKGIIYPTCISKNPCRLNQEDMDGNNLDIEESHHKDKYKNNDIIQFKCKTGFFETGSLLGKCIQSNIAYPKCLNERPCLLSQPKMDDANIELLPRFGNIQYVENSKTVQFRCKAQFKKHRRSSEMTQICDSGVITYPSCVPDP